MGEIWIMLAVMAALMAGCAAGGCWIARRIGYSPAVVVAGLTAAAMLLFGKYLADSVWIAQIVPGRMLPVFGNWLPLLAGLLAGVGWVISRRPAWMRVIILGVLLVCAMYVPYRGLFEEHPHVSNAWAGDLCLQTTDATCGAAAAATLLRSVGIASSEQEMANLCFTTWRGTPLHGVVRGLTEKTQGTPWRVKVLNADFQTLKQLGSPSILRVGLDDNASPASRYVKQWGWTPGVAHMVVLNEVIGDGRLQIADPSTGWEAWDPAALDVLWRGIAITLERREGQPASEMVSRE